VPPNPLHGVHSVPGGTPEQHADISVPLSGQKASEDKASVSEGWHKPSSGYGSVTRGPPLCCQEKRSIPSPWCSPIKIVCIANQQHCTRKDCHQRFLCLPNTGEPSSQGEISAIDCSSKRFGGNFPCDETSVTPFEMFWRRFSQQGVRGLFSFHATNVLIVNSSEHKPNQKGVGTRRNTIVFRTPPAYAEGWSRPWPSSGIFAMAKTNVKMVHANGTENSNVQIRTCVWTLGPNGSQA